jgi:hypothetical protein
MGNLQFRERSVLKKVFDFGKVYGRFCNCKQATIRGRQPVKRLCIASIHMSTIKLRQTFR